jgi:hypothetical protein
MTSQKHLKLTILYAFCCLVLINCVNTTSAQNLADTTPSPSPTPAPTPESEAVKRLKDKKDQAELRKAIAEAEKAEREARFPSPETKPLEGKTTIDGVIIEPQILSYKALNNTASKIVTQIKGAGVSPKIQKLAIFNEQEVNYLLSYSVAFNQLQIMSNGYDRVLKPPAEPLCALPKPTTTATPTPSATPVIKSDVESQVLTMRSMNVPTTASLIGTGISAAGSILGSFIDLTGLLRTNIDIKGQTFKINEEDLVAAVLQAVHDGKNGLGQINSYYPAMFPPKIDPNQNYVILCELENVYAVRTKAEKLIGDLADNETKINKLKAQIETLERQIKELNEQLTQEESAKIGFDELKKEYLGRKEAIPFELNMQILNSINRINQLKRQGSEEVSKLNQAKDKLKSLEAERTQLVENFAKTANTANLEDAVARLIGLNNQFDEFVEALIEPKESGVNSLTGHILAENLIVALQGDGSYWLQLQLVNAGGNNRIKTNLLVDIFTGGNRLSHSGGAIVEYILYRKDGEAVASGIVTDYTGYKKSSNIRKMP